MRSFYKWFGTGILAAASIFGFRELSRNYNTDPSNFDDRSVLEYSVGATLKYVRGFVAKHADNPISKYLLKIDDWDLDKVEPVKDPETPAADKALIYEKFLERVSDKVLSNYSGVIPISRTSPRSSNMGVFRDTTYVANCEIEFERDPSKFELPKPRRVIVYDLRGEGETVIFDREVENLDLEFQTILNEVPVLEYSR